MPATTFTHDQSLGRKGRIFDVRYFYKTGSLLADLASCELLVVTGSTGLHVDVQIKAVGTMEVFGFYGTTVSALGTEITPLNRNPVAAAAAGYTPEAKFYHNPTVTADGTEMYEDLLPAGATQGSHSAGASIGAGVGYYLAPNTNFLLRITNVSGAAARMIHIVTGHEGT